MNWNPMEWDLNTGVFSSGAQSSFDTNCLHANIVTRKFTFRLG